jgi:hypothetical protein
MEDAQAQQAQAQQAATQLQQQLHDVEARLAAAIAVRVEPTFALLLAWPHAGLGCLCLPKSCCPGGSPRDAVGAPVIRFAELAHDMENVF